MRFGAISLIFLLATPAFPRQEFSSCGTNREKTNETLFLHRQSQRARTRLGLRNLQSATASANRDIGDIALIEDTDGVVARQNEFNLQGATLRFVPSAPNAAQ